MKTTAGIDYSLTSPAICFIRGDDIEIFYLTNKKKFLGNFGTHNNIKIVGMEHQEYNDPIERFANISQFVMNLLNGYYKRFYSNPKIYIEGYAYGAKGQGLFQIAENCGILKYRILEKEYEYDTVVPSVAKKFATGKGNADKQLMYDNFVKDTGVDLLKILDTTKVGNPVSDIVDSYYIARYGYENTESTKTSR